MKIKIVALVFLIITSVSCKDDETQRDAENLKDIKKRELVFDVVNKCWVFNIPVLQPQAQAVVGNWTEWRMFLSELKQKPKSSIGAFQQKAKTLSKKVFDLNNSIPIKFTNRAVRSRIAVLTTQIHSLDLYVNLHDIPSQKVVALIPEINLALASLEAQFEEIVRKEQIPVEQGESDMIRMLDTSRAIPSSKNNSIVPKI